MIYKIFETLDQIFGIEEVKAHCDIPCGIYDPITAQSRIVAMSFCEPRSCRLQLSSQDRLASDFEHVQLGGYDDLQDF